MTRVDKGEIRLPEIQRGYVWKPTQVAGLFDSLYKNYPSGSLLFWETEERVAERAAAIEGPSSAPMVRPQYLLDGQQRLTSLHRVFVGHQHARLVFNVVTERFQMSSAAAEKDLRWVSVRHLLTGEIDTFSTAVDINAKHPSLAPPDIHARLEQVKRIGNYSYLVEILDNVPYDEVTEIFVRVNSRGRALKSTDLALAMLSARWPGTVARMEELADGLAARGFRHLDLTFLVRLLAGLATESTTLAGLQKATTEELEAGWNRVRRGLDHLLPLLKNNVGVDTSAMVTSITALIPMAAFLGLRDDAPLENEEVKSLVYWMFAANLSLRYSAGKETRLRGDLGAVRKDDPLSALLRNLNLMGERLVVKPESLVGRGVSSPYFLLSYLVAKRRQAKDWFFGVDIGPGMSGSLAIEYHHIHPRARLRDEYTKAEINDLANLAFISAKANRKISSRRPADYFPEVGDENLRAHLVPLDHELREPERYLDFLRARRQHLAEAMTELLDGFRPERVGAVVHEVSDPQEGDRVAIAIWRGDRTNQREDLVDFTAERDGRRWRAVAKLTDFDRYLVDVASSLASEFKLSGRTVTASEDAETVHVPVGPFLVEGDLDDWRLVLDRERESARPLSERPEEDLEAWVDGEVIPFPVQDSE